MVRKYGMDEDLGTLVYYDSDKSEYTPFQPFSEKTAEKIDKKVKELVGTAYERALKLIKDNKKIISKMAELLLEKEYISKEEFSAMMKDPKQIDGLIAEFRKKHEKLTKKKAKTAKKVKEHQDELFKEENNDKEKIKSALDNFLNK